MIKYVRLALRFPSLVRACFVSFLRFAPDHLKHTRRRRRRRRYEMLLVCAAKTAASALRLPRGPAGNAPLLSSGALETTAYAYSLIQSRSNRRKGSFGTSKGVRCVCKARTPMWHFTCAFVLRWSCVELFDVRRPKKKNKGRLDIVACSPRASCEGGAAQRADTFDPLLPSLVVLSLIK